jgi:predicted transcriptional regulator of viral defense system
MPRVSASGRASPSWAQLYEVAAAQGGYFTSKQAGAIGYSPALLQYYRRQERVESWRRGIFRIVHFPVTDHEDLVPLWLWTDQKGVFSHETALVLYDLSDALPAKKHLTLPEAWRKRRLRVPDGTMLHYGDLSTDEMTWMGPVPVTTVLRTIFDCTREGAGSDLVRQAISQSVSRGLLTREDVKALTRAKIR